MSQATIEKVRPAPLGSVQREVARWLWLPVAAALVALWPQLVGNNAFYVKLAAEAGILIVLTSALNLALGYTDLVSMAHSGLYALGAYTVGLLIARLKLSFVLALPAAFVLAGLMGAVMTLATLRAAHLYFAMITLSFNLILLQLALAWTGLTNGEDGIVGIRYPTLLGDTRLDLTQYFYLIWIIVGVSFWLLRNVVKSRYGRAFMAIRGDEDTASTLGVPLFKYKLLSFTLSAGFAGLAGALYAHLNGFVNPSLAALDSTLKVFVGLLIGGSGTITGPVLGVIFAVSLERLLVIASDSINKATGTTTGTAYQMLAYGVVLLLTMVLIPRGIVGTWLQSRPGRYVSRLFQARVAPPPPEQTRLDLSLFHPRDATLLQKRGTAPILSVKELKKYFGGLKALNGVSFEVGYGEMHGLIGPNGSGKSTTVNVISGYMPRTAGTLAYGGMTLTRPRPHLLARWGIVRIFQASRLFGELSVLENMLVGFHLHSRQNLLDALLHLPRHRRDETDLRQRALVLLEQVGLGDKAYLPATILSHGQRRLLEVARALAVGPALLILDEPATGLTAEELRGLAALLLRLKEAGVAVLLIEHNMDFLMKLVENITVFDYGQKIAEGPPAQVRHNPQVITAYLGADETGLEPEPALTEDSAAWSEVSAALETTTGKGEG